VLASLAFFRRQYLAHYSASLDQWSPNYYFVHQGWIGLQSTCDLSFESVDKFKYCSNRLKCCPGVLFGVSTIGAILVSCLCMPMLTTRFSMQISRFKFIDTFELDFRFTTDSLIIIYITGHCMYLRAWTSLWSCTRVTACARYLTSFYVLAGLFSDNTGPSYLDSAEQRKHGGILVWKPSTSSRSIESAIAHSWPFLPWPAREIPFCSPWVFSSPFHALWSYSAPFWCIIHVVLDYTVW